MRLYITKQTASGVRVTASVELMALLVVVFLTFTTK
jgi:hypothetical protein